MRINIILLFAIIVSCTSQAQKQGEINVKEVERIERTLASDEMRGRRAGTPDIDKAAQFIAAEFKKAGLQPMEGNSGFLQEFKMVRAVPRELKYEAKGVQVEAKDIVVITTQKELKIDEKSGYEVSYIKAGDNLMQKAQGFIRSNKNMIVYVQQDSTLSKAFPNLTRFRRPSFASNHSVAFIFLNQAPESFTIKVENDLQETKFTNVVGIIPGKSKKNEYVVFSAHYDHLGIARQPKDGDSIYNGANDNAAGTTAVIMLADHFKKAANNERTLVFAAFTAEESGGFGSQYFSRQFDPAQVMAMFNIEMIGTESKWGKNSAYITGYDKTNMGEIMQKNLEGSSFTFHPDPYTKENLFYRSDNATLARLGVPAHTISTAKMEGEPNYHQVTDHIETLDMNNMAEIIKAIAISSRSIVAGKDTPSRVKPESLN